MQKRGLYNSPLATSLPSPRKGEGSQATAERSRVSEGFTLVELSIVIVIIGVIIAGIVASRSVLENTKLQRVISDLTEYAAAVKAFKLKYNDYPGDMPDASSYWGTWNESVSTGVRNGNGDLSIAQVDEDQSAWHHLHKAGLGDFDNSTQLKSYVDNDYERTDRNQPQGPLLHSQYRLAGDYSSLNFFDSKDSNALFLTSYNVTSVSGGALNFMVMTAKQAYTIDRKFDDGIANKGIIMGAGGYSKTDGSNAADADTCSKNATTVAPSTAQDYINLTSDSINCFIAYFFED